MIEQFAMPDQVKLELRAQIEMALNMGIDITHLDSHAGSVLGLYTGRDFLEVVFDLCEQFQLPFNIPKGIVRQPFLSDDQRKRFEEKLAAAECSGMLFIDDQCGLSYHLAAEEGYGEMKSELINLIINIKPGITQIVTHPAIVSDELVSITPHFLKRELEYNLYKDPQIKALFREEKIKLSGLCYV